MLSERFKIQNARAANRLIYTGATTSSGDLVAGKFYRITEFKSGDDFSNVGAPSSRCSDYGAKGRTGAIFQATGTTPALWTNGSRLTELKVVELRAKFLELYNAAREPVTINSGSFEGGQGSGVVTNEPSIEVLAIEQLLQEMDPDYVHTTTFPRRPMGITVRL